MGVTPDEKRVLDGLRGLERRDFLRAAAMAVTAGALRPDALLGAFRRGGTA